MYLSNSFGPKEREKVASGEYAGWFVSPQTRGIPRGVRRGDKWAGDNLCFSNEFTPERFTTWARKMRPYRKTCLFLVAPDVLGDCWATRERWLYWYPILSGMQFPVAYVGQDWQPADALPRQEMNTYFVGGTDAWKDSAESLAIVTECRRRGMRVHVGRANTHARLSAFFKAYRLDGDPQNYIPGFTYDGNGIRWRTAAELAPAQAVLKMERLL